MSTESNDADDSGYDPADVYDNPEVKDELDEKRQRLQQHREEEKAKQAADAKTSRQMIADEEQPDPNAPDLRETYTVDFRGHDFTFYELGDVAIEAAQYQGADDDVEEGTKAAHFVYRTLGEKSADPGVNESYWRQYDFDDVMDLFFDLIEEASDVDEDEVEEIDEFRDE